MNTKTFCPRIAFCLLVLLSLVMLAPSPVVTASSSGVVISQIYGGGGNAGSTFKNDFIELFNASGAPVAVDGWSVQYASTTGTTWQVTNLSGSIAPGQYYLVQESQGTGGTTPLPTPNATGTIAMSATGGKVALVSSTVALSGGCPVGGAIVDFVGYDGASCFEGAAAAPTLSNTLADFRRNNGAQDTDNNSADFVTGAPAPRNSSVSSTNPTGVGSATPASLAAGGSVLLKVVVTPGVVPTSTGITVIADLSGIGGAATQTLFDDATNGDVTANDNTFSFATTVGGGTTPGAKSLPATVQDAQGRSSTAAIALTVTAPPLNLAIHDIQGSGDTSPFVTRLVSTTGIVTARKNNGFFIQTPDSDVDGDPATSEGVFVFTSSAPPAAATVGNLVTVTGTVSEFIPSSDPNSPPATEISGSPSVSVISTGNPLPTPVTLTTADTDPSGPIDQREKYEGMRVHVDVLNVTAPTQGNVSEANATSTSNGIFFGVLPGIARPFREPGVQLPDPLPAGAPAGVTRFDSNPELIRIDSGTLTGSTKLDVTSGATVTGLTGPLDFSSRFYTIDIDPGSGAVATGNVSATPVPLAAPNELTIASFNMERFFDTVNDPGTSDVALSATAFANRLNKASLAIRNVLNMPDIIGVEEMENLTTLQALADKVNTDAVAASQPNPNYHAFLVEGNDVGGIDVGLLIKDRINVIDVQQAGKDTTFVEPGGSTALLNDRPPLVLTATASQPGSDTSLPFTMVVNHLRSLLSIDDPVDGARVRAKREAQAEFLANLLQSHQAAGENVISVCDCNAFEFSDGYVDVIGTILGRPTPADQVVTASPDLVDPDFTDLVTTLPHDQQYSFVFDGTAQVLDHIVVNSTLLSKLSRFAYARNDADFPEVFRSDPNRPERISDHDMPVAYFTLPEPTPPVLHLPADISVEATGPGGAMVTFTATATDAVDASVVVTCVPPSGSVFPVGTTVVNCSATNSRNKTATGSFSVNVDAPAPVLHLPANLTAEATSAAGAVVTFSATATDAVDITVPVTCVPASGSVFSFGPTTVNCSATNSHSKTTSGSFSVTVVDTTAPVVLVLGVSNGATYILGAVPTATCSTADSASGVALPATLSLTGGTANGVGHFTATCSGAVDNAGNAASPVSVSYDVHYIFKGFLPPLRPGSNGGSFELGREIDLRWELLNAQGRHIVNRSAILALQAAFNASCTIGGEGPAFNLITGHSEIEIEGGRYEFDWRTKGLSPGCYSILLSLDDGTTQRTIVNLRRDRDHDQDNDDRDHDGDDHDGGNHDDQGR
jgi:predicted extracellular nuclease